MADLSTTMVLGDLIVTGDIINEGLANQEHSHAAATTTINGFMSKEDKIKLNGLNNYIHPTNDGNLHMPVTGTTNSGKFLKAGNTAGSVSWSTIAWGDIVSKPSTFTPSSHTHSISNITGVAAEIHTHDEIIVRDTRAVNTLPKDRDSVLTADFKSNTATGLVDGGMYHGIMHFRPYGHGTDFSGGPAHQLGFTSNGNLWMRSGSNETWNAWKKFLFKDETVSITNSYPSIELTQRNKAKTRLINDSDSFWIEGTSTGAATATSRLRFELATGNLYVGNNNKRVLTQNDDAIFSTTGKAYIGANTNAVSTVPIVTLAIGDADTGLHWNADGNFSLYADSQQIVNINTGSVTFHKATNFNAGTNRFIANSNIIGAEFNQGSIEIREVNQVSSAQTAYTYAPSIGFHWRSTKAATIALHSDGHFYFRAQGYTGTQYRNIYCNELRAVRAYNAVWNDYAEFFEKEDLDEAFEPGDVVVWNKNGVTKSKEANSSKVIGVFSDTYGHIVGGEEGVANIEDNYAKFVPVGLAGRVSVNLVGNIKIGDLITTSDIEGVAMKSTDKELGTIIGKALEDKDDEGIRRISIMIFNT